MQNKAVAYARVSSREQQEEGFSIPSQLKLVREYADKNKLNLIKEFAEAETAKKAGRTEFNKMLLFLKENPDIKIVVVEKTDRLYRNFKDYIILEDYDLQIHLVKENQILSKDSKSHEKFIHGIKVLMAKNYSDNLSEEVKKGKQEKVEQGGYPYIAPLGYQNTVISVNDKKKENGIVPKPEEARLVRALFELYATGNYSLFTLRKKVIEEGLTACLKTKKIPTSSIARVLQSPVYYGAIPYKGKIYSGNHELIISKELFDKVQDILTGKGKKKGKARRSFPYTGLMVCGGCGLSITAEKKKGKYVYYHCTNYKRNCNKKSIKEEKVEIKFAELLNGMHMDGERLEWLKEGLKLSHEEEAGYREEMIASLERECKTIRERIDKAYIDKIDGKISEAFWLQNNEKWEKQEIDLIKAIELHKEANKNYMNAGITLVEAAQRAYNNFLERNVEEKRELLDFMLSNSVLTGQNLVSTLKEPFSYSAECVKTGNIRRR
ncbi:MAG: recombinase family protein [Candidatus Melainabacteria bacterium]|nr:recombinase family protein [Candidatus Melainabacteria bacterium]